MLWSSCIEAHHSVSWVNKGGGQCKKKGEVIIYNYFVFYVRLFPRNCCRLKSELHPTLKIKYWEITFSFNTVTDRLQPGKGYLYLKVNCWSQSAKRSAMSSFFFFFFWVPSLYRSSLKAGKETLHWKLNYCEEQSPFKAQSPISVTAPIIRIPLAMLQTRHLRWKWKTEQLQWRCGKEQHPKERPISAQYLQLSCSPFLILLMNGESTGAHNTCYRNPQNYCSRWAEMEETPKGVQRQKPFRTALTNPFIHSLVLQGRERGAAWGQQI